MFIGHYGPAFGAKAAMRAIPLWVLFIAVQWMDVWWAAFVLTGIEKVRIIPGFTEGSPLDLYFMPFTHGLLGSLVFSAIFGGIVALFFKQNRRAVFWVTAAAVFSHWVADFLVHVPDLPLWDDSMKVGLGLWRNIWISMPLELASITIGAIFYARYVPARGRVGNVVFWIFVAAMAGLQLYAHTLPPPASPADAAQTALIAYGALAILAGLVDLTRKANP